MIQNNVNRWWFVCFHVFFIHAQIDSKRYVVHPLLFPPARETQTESKAPEESLFLLFSIKSHIAKPSITHWIGAICLVLWNIWRKYVLLSSVRKSHSAVPIFYVSIYYFEQCRCMPVFRKIILISAASARRVQDWGKAAHVNVTGKKFYFVMVLWHIGMGSCCYNRWVGGIR